MLWPGSVSQVIPGELFDQDDCWVAATIWAALASDPTARKPTFKEFRAAAGDPDDGVLDGGNLDEVIKGSRGIWPALPVTKYAGTWEGFISRVKDGRPASLAVNSARLPPHLQYGFKGAHQIGVAWDDGLVMVNPLARNGTPPQPITEAQLKAAATALYQWGQVRAAIYPVPEDPMVIVTKYGPWTVDIAVGKTLYDLNGKPLTKVSIAQQDRPAPSETEVNGITYVMVLVTTGGERQYVLVKASDISDRKLVGAPRAYAVKVSIGGDVVTGNVTLP